MASNGRTCGWCAARFDDPSVLQEHEQFHRDIDSFDLTDIQFDADTFLESLNDPELILDFACDECDNIYTHKRSLTRHKKSQHGNGTFSCPKCEKRFNRGDCKIQHEKTCGGVEHMCAKCGKRCSTAYGLRRHLQWHEKAPLQNRRKTPGNKRKSVATRSPAPCSYRCRKCTESFGSRRDLYLHGMRHHYQTGGSLQTRPWSDVDAPWINDDETVDSDLKEIYEANSPLILEPHREGPIQNVYNFPINNDVTVNLLMDYAREIFERQQRGFRLNLVFGVILRNRETGQYRYFVPYDRTGIFQRPLYVSRMRDLDRLRIRLEKMDITTELLRQRPDTKWIPVLVTNVHYTVDSTHFPVGFGELPEYLLNKESIYPLVKSRHTGKPYDDDLCAFRCLALHRGHDIKSIEGPARDFYRRWREFGGNSDGISYDQFPAFEDLFEINMEVYGLEDDGFARSVYKSRGLRDSTMYVNLHENHLSYVRDFSLYAQKYRCETCDRHFQHARDLHRHQRVCTDKTKYVYPGGFHRAQDSVFDQLDEFGIHVPADQRTFSWFICYDFEAVLEKVYDRPTEFLRWTHKHVAISVSICSNAEGHEEPFCIVEQDQNELVRSMVAYMEEISSKIKELAEDKWGWVLEEIDRKIGETRPDEDDEVKRDINPLHKLGDRVSLYMSQAPVIGFNSAKYDLNLVKRYLAKHLELQDNKASFVVKQNNSYTCIATDTLKFLDMTQYLAAGSSYAGFLKAYRVEETKGYFPYEWFDDVTKLEHSELPPHEAFYSSLKGSNICEEQYRLCQRQWREQNMSRFRDFLVWYNNLDVGPFVTAVERFQEFYFDKGIDVFKTAISVPGIARQLLFRTAKNAEANFALFDKQSEDLYDTFKRNIVGGPSIIFTRHHKAGQTRIRGRKKCGSILGFDANALYLQAIGQPMPVGPFVRRRADNDFRPELRDRFMSAYYWMDWIRHRDEIEIRHKLNSGSEVRVGPYPVDGFSDSSGTQTCYQFQGCYWHGHLCEVTKNVSNERWLENRERRYKRTLETTDYLRRSGYRVEEMWECEFREYCRRNPEIYPFIDSTRPGFYQKHRDKISEKRILEGVDNDELFGAVEVDIEVPERWPSVGFRHPSMTPSQYFEEMSPLFCTIDIPFDVIGEHMQSHVNRHDLSKTPRRLLVGGTKARQILLATPLLKWYMNHGMVVTKIYQLVEFRRQRCFENFVREVSDARRQGDSDPDTTIIADTMKVIGNSGYGSLIMDKTKHTDVKYVQGENETSMKVNDPRFRKLECLDEEEQFYEVEMAKKKIKLDLPIQLGYFVLQYAKLRMLEFYYDFVDVYVSREDFQYCEMDTDSAYMAISGSSLEDVVKPEAREKYRRGLEGFCTDENIEADDDCHWFPRTCCQKHAKHDKRTPGLFKLEYSGHEMIGLCSKTYIVRKSRKIEPSSARVVAHRLLQRAAGRKPKRLKYRTTDEYKFISKGVSKRRLKGPMSVFRHVLRTGNSRSGVNVGFRVRNNTMFTYSQERRGFSYFYCKRRVLDDGINTAPLDITLCPFPDSEI